MQECRSSLLSHQILTQPEVGFIKRIEGVAGLKMTSVISFWKELLSTGSSLRSFFGTTAMFIPSPQQPTTSSAVRGGEDPCASGLGAVLGYEPPS